MRPNRHKAALVRQNRKVRGGQVWDAKTHIRRRGRRGVPPTAIIDRPPGLECGPILPTYTTARPEGPAVDSRGRKPTGSRRPLEVPRISDKSTAAQPAGGGAVGYPPRLSKAALRAWKAGRSCQPTQLRGPKGPSSMAVGGSPRPMRTSPNRTSRKRPDREPFPGCIEPF